MSSLGIAQIRSWQPSVLASAAASAKTAAGQLDGVASSVSGRIGGSGWEGAGAFNAEERAGAEAKTGRGLSDALSSAAPALSEGAASITEARDHLLRLVAHAEAANMTVSDTGSVKAPAAHVTATAQESEAGATGEAHRQGRLKAAQAALNAKAKAFADQIQAALEAVAAVDEAVAGTLSSIGFPAGLAAGVAAYLGAPQGPGATGPNGPTGPSLPYCPPSAPPGYHFDPSAMASTQAAIERARLLAQSDPGLAPFMGGSRNPLQAGYELGKAGKKGFGLYQKDAAVARYFSNARKAAELEGTPALMAYLKAGEKYEDLVHGNPVGGLASKLPGSLGGLGGDASRLAGKAFLPMTAFSGVSDAITGGGYDGARGAATRGFGAAGALGAGAIVVGGVASAPVVVVGGTVAVTAYGAWSIGNTVYDHRDDIADAGHAVSDAAGDVGGYINKKIYDLVTVGGLAG